MDELTYSVIRWTFGHKSLRAKFLSWQEAKVFVDAMNEVNDGECAYTIHGPNDEVIKNG